MNSPKTIVKSVVLLSAIALSFLVLYFASQINFEFLPTLGFSTTLFSVNNSNNNVTSTLGDVHHNEPVHDEYYELRKVLQAASTKEKTVILATLNKAWAEPNSIFDLFLESFRIGNNTSSLLNHLIVIAVDEKAYTRCETSVSYCYLLKSNHSSELASEARFMTPSYVELVWNRLGLLQTILSLGYNFVQTDTDVMWFRDPFPHFDSKSDIQTSCDRYNGRPFDLNNAPNNGFVFVRSNNRTIEFYKYWVSSKERYPNLHEQDAFNRIKQEPFFNETGLRLRFMDTDYFGGFCSPSRDFNKVCTMHANCCVGLVPKTADLSTTLEDWNMYLSMSLQANQTAPLQQFQWRVPHHCHM